MKIYIDFDDVICETAKYFTKIAKELFNIDVPYREVQFFNLQKSFDLSGEQYDELMKAGHIPENLLDYEETPGASEVINKWVDEGHEVFVVTGRPFDSYEPSRRWLDEHHLNRLPIYFVDKDDGGDRCFGILADMDFIIICTYEKDGENPELLIYKKRY